MVVFTCQHCGDSVKKPAVEKHYNTKCRHRSLYLTCVDCLKDFSDDFVGHNECMTEEHRYSAQGTVAKEQKGKKKQEEYIEMIHQILNSKESSLSPIQRKLLEVCSNHSNVPRKIKRFENFMQNVAKYLAGKWTNQDLKYVFKVIEDAWKKRTELNGTSTKVEKCQGKEATDLAKTRNNEEANNKSKKKRKSDNSLTVGDDLDTMHENEKTDCDVNEQFTNDKSNVKPKKSKKEKQRAQSLSEGYVDQVKEIFLNGSCNGDLSFTECNQANIERSKGKSPFQNTKNINNEEENHGNGFGEKAIDIKDTNSEIKENTEKISKKKLKKQKKYEKYLAELNNEASEVNENAMIAEVEDSEFSFGTKKNKKKNKKMKTNDFESTESLGLNEDINVENVSDLTKKAPSKQNKKRKLEGCVGETPEKRTKVNLKEGEEGAVVAMFNWAEVISRVLQSQPNKELSLKKLGKKVINEYQTLKQDHRTYEELRAKFNKKVNKTKGVRVLHDKAKLIE